jgi:hypothetical protein
MTSRNLLLQPRLAAPISLATYSEFINTINIDMRLTLEGGLSISETTESAKTSDCFKCPNSSCRKVFPKPLKATNLQKDSSEPYDACPFCLTEITAENAITFSEADAEKDAEQNGSPKRANAGISPTCKNHFGYLSERPSKEQIPEECLTCREIVQCMLKKTLE